MLQLSYKQTGKLIWMSILFTGMLVPFFRLQAQQQRQDKKTSRIDILDNESGEFIQSDSITVHKLLHHVKLLHGSDTLYCDSAFFYTDLNSVEAFGDVVIRQADGTEAYADYMRYTGNNRVVYMRSNNPMADVKLFDGKTNSLYSREIDYNLLTKIGRFRNRGYLETQSTILQSNNGTYNMRSKDARFTGDVDVADPDYHVVSTDLGYNTDTELVTFFGPSTVTNDQSVLITSSGTYDSRKKQAHFVQRAAILSQAQYIEGDTLDYDRISGVGIARGNVIAIDTGMHTTLYCGYAEYNEISGVLWAYIEPVIKRKEGSDSSYIRVDTFYSAPDTFTATLTAQDSLQKTAEELQAAVAPAPVNSQGLADSTMPPVDTVQMPSSGAVEANDTFQLIPDFGLDESMDIDSSGSTPTVDTSLSRIKGRMDSLVYKDKPSVALPGADRAQYQVNPQRLSRLNADSISAYPDEDRKKDHGPRYFIGYNNVLIYADSLQGKCDSITYSQVDSVLRMFKNPLLWPRNSQLKGDEIHMYMDSGRLRELHVPRNAIMVTRSGPEQANMFDQIQGNSIRAYLRNNKMDSLIAEPNASSIYFIQDDDKAYVGSSEAKSERIEVIFENEEIDRIYYRRDVEQTTIPMKDVTPATLRLSRFSWEEELRPKSLEAFLNGRVLPNRPLLFEFPEPEPLPEPETDVPVQQEVRKPE